MSKRIDLTGQRFGRLTAISFEYVDKNGSANWLCKCDCGNTTTVPAYRLRLKKGNVSTLV